MKHQYDIGDDVWIYAGEVTEEGTALLSKGKVIEILLTPYRAFPQYVILMDDPDFYSLEIRDVYLMSPSPNQLPAYNQIRPYRSVAKKV